MSRWSVIAGILMMLLAASPDVDAGRKPRRCKTDSQCPGSQECCTQGDGRCCAGTCNTIGECCNALAGEAACGGDCCDTLRGVQCCGGGCADTSSDNANCGGCGNACAGGTTCQNGACTCPSGEMDCNGQCVDTTSDAQNCGSCGNACSGAYQQCTNGTCGCVPGLTPCDAGCVDVTSDPHNCGSCSNLCGSGECVDGACTPCTGFNKGCNFDEVCQNGACVKACSQAPPGSAVDGDFVACDDGNGGFYCGCNGCTQCGFGEACCSCGCIFGVYTTCADFCQSR